MPEEIVYTANGKNYSSVEEAVAEYIEAVKPGVSPAKLDKILKAINLDIFENLVSSLTFLKSPVTPLSPRTIARKGHDRPFLDKGIMFNSVKDQLLNDLHGQVFMAEVRDEIGFRLNEGTNRIPQREFWGLSDQVLDKIDIILLEDD